MKNKITKIIEGAVLVALGVLIAVFGGGEVLNVYYGVIALVAGVALLTLSVVTVVTKKPLTFGALFLGAALVVVGAGLLSGLLQIADQIITLIVLVVMGLGIGLILYGAYTIIEHNLFNGVGQIVIGAVCVVLSALYLGLADFRVVFWIIVGVVVALYGLFVIISVFFDKEKKALKEKAAKKEQKEEE